MNFKDEMKQKVAQIEIILDEYLPAQEGLQKTVLTAMNTTVKAGGKRLRPMLINETYQMFGGKGDIVKPFMAAIEMIHTYSLIHDDLPALDNDDYRRGQKTCHIVYGEDMAILAGDALLNYAYEVATKAFDLAEKDQIMNVVEAIKILASKPGIYGMIGGQVADVELAYAVSDYPDRDFRYGGAIISNGDIGYQGRKTEDALNYWGNIHGSIVQAAGQWYVFYHRQTNRTEQSRQGCAEPIRIDENGRIAQVEMTSQGLYGKLLPGAGTYPAYIACNLYSEQGAIKCTYGPFCRHQFRMHPCFRMGRDGHQFIQDMRDGATAGFKYFDMQNPKRISVTVRGDSGTVLVRTSPEKQPIAVIQIDKTSAWRTFLANLPPLAGKTELYFTFTGEGKMDFLSFALHETMI